MQVFITNIWHFIDESHGNRDCCRVSLEKIALILGQGVSNARGTSASKESERLNEARQHTFNFFNAKYQVLNRESRPQGQKSKRKPVVAFRIARTPRRTMLGGPIKGSEW
jgi:hypothetical protein